MFLFSLSREFYHDLIVVCVFCSHCLLLRSCLLVYSLLFHTHADGLLVNKFAVVVGVAYVYHFNVKGGYTVSIFVIICIS